jgi:hypothetical protein
VHDPDPSAVENQRSPEQGAKALGPEDRAHDLDRADVLDDHRGAPGRDRARDPAPERDPHVEPHLFLEAVGGPDGQLRTRLVQQEDDDRVGGQGLPHPPEELAEEVVEAQVRERSVRHALNRLDLMGCRLESEEGVPLAAGEALGTRLRAPEGRAHEADDQRFHEKHAEAGHDRRAQRYPAGSRPDERRQSDYRAHDRGQQPGSQAAVPRAQHDRSEEQGKVAPVHVRLQRVGEEPCEDGGGSGEEIPLPGARPVGKRGGGSRAFHQGAWMSGHWSFPA